MPYLNTPIRSLYMKKRIFRICLLSASIPLFPLSIHAQSKSDEEMAYQTRWVVNTINARHYLRDSMKQLDGSEMVKAYIDSFDPSRMYFLRTEVDDFVFRFAETMEQFLQKGNLYAAIEIFKSFERRSKERTHRIYECLEGDFDFSVDETFNPDRQEAEWPMTTAAADTLWLQRLKYELLNEMFSLVIKDEQTDKNSTPSENPDFLILSDSDQDPEFNPDRLLKLLEDESFYETILNTAKSNIRRRYECKLNRTITLEVAKRQESFINAMTQIFDPHSTFLSADTLEKFNLSVQNSFVGIGAVLEDDECVCTVKSLLPGGPAERSGHLRPGDQILGVAQGDDEFENVIDRQLSYIVRKIKGPKGSTVRLLIRPDSAIDPSERKIIRIVRDQVKLTENLASAKLITVPGNGNKPTPVGVIEIPSFYGSIGTGDTLTTISKDVTELIHRIREAGAEGIILDMRMNGGGLLKEAVEVAGLFIPVGPIVQVRNSWGRKEILSDKNSKMLWEGPLIVLTSRFSASASEIVAGALQDHKRALIVGNSSTHGKGTVQEVYYMNQPRPFSIFRLATPTPRTVASKITIKQFYLPDGSSTQVRGVLSDVVLPSFNEFLPIGEDDLPHALPWDEIEPVNWKKHDWSNLNIDGPENPLLIEQLVQSSRKRQEELEEFRFLREQIDWRRELYDQKAISINLQQRVEQRINEQGQIQALKDSYETLRQNDFEMETFLLRIAEKQAALSKAALARIGESTDESTPVDSADKSGDLLNEADAEEDESPAYDIHLRESARIMADWIQLIRHSKSTASLAQ